MTIKLEKADITSIEDAMKRLVDGEEFEYHGRRIFFEHDTDELEYPFRVERDKVVGTGSEPVQGFWSSYARWEIRTTLQWFDDITDENHVLCFVSDDEDGLSQRAEYVINHREGDSYPFETRGSVYRFARPVTADDLQIKPDTSGC